ncbi:hypothetical protein GCM10009665_54350 [Kitasatospora nipponensis]|uniref:Uncharacterized protein n=1 Tax=Kitasatospora nipponensis TaxID=258049 RepID=A0ABN1WQI4_9ACTN
MLGDGEGAGRVLLAVAAVQAQRHGGEPTEAHVHQPRLVQFHAQAQVVEQRAGHPLVDDPGGQQFDPVAERAEQRGERAVEFVAEAAAPVVDQLGDQGLGVQHDRLAEPHAQVLERYGPQVRPLQGPQPRQVRRGRARGADPGQVGVHACVVHGPRLLSNSLRRGGAPARHSAPGTDGPGEPGVSKGSEEEN